MKSLHPVREVNRSPSQLRNNEGAVLAEREQKISDEVTDFDEAIAHLGAAAQKKGIILTSRKPNVVMRAVFCC
jgi:hypothetical protein